MNSGEKTDCLVGGCMTECDNLLLRDHNVIIVKVAWQIQGTPNCIYMEKILYKHDRNRTISQTPSQFYPPEHCNTVLASFLLFFKFAMDERVRHVKFDPGRRECSVHHCRVVISLVLAWCVTGRKIHQWMVGAQWASDQVPFHSRPRSAHFACAPQERLGKHSLASQWSDRLTPDLAWNLHCAGIF